MKLDKAEALRMLDLDKCSDYNAIELKTALPKALFIEDKNTDTQCFIMPYKEVSDITDLVIVFRGTEPKLKDWMTDIDGFQMVIPYGNKDSNIRVHGGILKAYKSVRDALHRYIDPIKEKVGVIHVVGHSLGGGLATLCAVDMQYNYDKITGPVVCYTYGALKVGNLAFVKSYNTRVPETYRIFIPKDVVPFMPPKFLEKAAGGKFVHVDNGFSIGPNNPFIGLIELIKRRFSKRLIEDLANHSIELYKKYLKI